MKTISVGDIHGRLSWKNIEPKDFDKIIFLGDYVDSFDIPDIQISNNLLDIIQFKKDYNDKVILLWGNHDIQYLFSYNGYGCTGYRPSMFLVLHEIFNINKELFQMSFQINDTIWTHAGIHQGWYIQRFNKFVEEFPKEKLSEQLNTAFYAKYESLFDVGHRRGGYHNVGGPFWADISELKSSPLKEYNQIVGHNRVDDITKIEKIVFTDCLEKNDHFYEKEFKE